MKKVVLLIGIILFMNLVSAGYNCSDGSLLTENRETMNLNDKISINQLYLILTSASHSPKSADLIIDVVEFALTDQSNSTVAEMKSGTKNITLMNLTSSRAVIKVGGDIKELEVGKVLEVDNREVRLSKADGAYPGTANVEGIIGKEMVSFINNESFRVVSINDTDYLIELSSTSNDQAIIIVKKCQNDSGNIIEFADPVVENVTIVENLTAAENVTSTENVTKSIVNSTSTEKNLESKTSDKKTPLFGTVILFILIAIVLGGILILSIVLFKNVKRENEIQVAQPDI